MKCLNVSYTYIHIYSALCVYYYYSTFIFITTKQFVYKKMKPLHVIGWIPVWISVFPTLGNMQLLLCINLILLFYCIAVNWCTYFWSLLLYDIRVTILVNSIHTIQQILILYLTVLTVMCTHAWSRLEPLKKKIRTKCYIQTIHLDCISAI